MQEPDLLFQGRFASGKAEAESYSSSFNNKLKTSTRRLACI